MCFQATNVPSVTLQTAVLMQVKDFANVQKTFSVHDITRTIREKTGNGEIEIPEVEVSGASFRFDIPHTKVKAIFDELWRTGVFDPFLTLSRNFNGTFFEYVPTPVNGASAAAPAPVVPTSAPIVAAATVASANRVDKQVVTSKVQTYLDNHAGSTVTIEQIRAGIKCNGWTCSEIIDIIRNSSTSATVTSINQYVSKVEVSIP